MTEPSLLEQIAAAENYQQTLVPALMETWAPRVAEGAGIRPGDRVLDVACGTGVLTREAARRAGSAGVVTGLDLSPGMLAVAARMSPDLHWEQGTAESLPFPDHSFDAVVSQFGLMFVPDPVAALREMNRVLVPGGRLAVAVWASLSETPVYAAEVALLERLAGKAPADVMRAPFEMGEPGRLEGLLRTAGISGTAQAQQGQGRFSSIRALMEVDLRGWLRFVGIVLEDDLISRILTEAETALRPHVTSRDGGVTFSLPAIVATAVKPAGEAGRPG